ncbi:MATE family efflux transporter [Sphingomonas sp. BT-65]|uniref:lipopolysaccharide biosynthesis protein n=1 Tax=Sphingomonas sp. BT-65 TaxID=2989821 RepID=UPI0022367CCB|nr:MATE family efflux transporter [Sphingomonas sp. BT-65]MCW4461894.1 MATE family efflux transporter [Sphingomonas sp. BT-65]
MMTAPADGTAGEALMRAAERRRRVLLSITSNVGARVASFAVILVASRFALADIGTERFGIWMTIASLLSVLNLLDFGIGNGLVVPVAGRVGRNDVAGLQRIVTLGLLTTLVIGAIAALLLVAAALYADWRWLFKSASSGALVEAGQALLVFATLLGLSLPLQTVHRILAGMQRAYLSHFLSLGCSTLSLIVLFATQSQKFDLVGYILLTLGIAQLPGLIALGFLAREGLIRPAALRCGAGGDFRLMFSAGGLFLALQFGALIGWGSDQILVSALSGPADAAVYAVGARIFMLVSIPFYIINAPLWAAYAEALDRGDREYARRTLRISLLATLGGATMFGLAMVLASPVLWQLFSGGALRYDRVLIWGLAIWTAIDCAANALAMFLNGAHLLKEQLWTVVVFVLLSIPLKAWVIVNISFSMIPFVTAVIYLGTLAIVYAFTLRRSIARVLSVPA